LFRDRAAPRRWALYGGLASTWIILAAIVIGESRSHSVGFTIGGWTPWSYLLTQTGVIAHYLRLAFVPSPLVIDYGWRQPESFIEVIAPAAILVALFAATVVGLMRRWPAAFLGVWLFLILAPTSSILPIATEVAAEHRMYLPLAAVIAAVVFGVGYFLRRFMDSSLRVQARAATAALVVAGLATVTLGAATASRNRDYWSDEALWRDAVEKRPQNPRARVCYGQDLFSSGRVAEAEQQFRTAVNLDDTYALAHLNLGGALGSLGRVDEGIAHLTRAAALDPASPDVYRNLGEAYASQGDMAKAVTYFNAAIDRQPTDVFSMNRLGWILATSRHDDLRNGARAVALAERAVALTSRGDVESLDTLAAALAESRHFDQATATMRQAILLAQRTGRDAMLPELNGRLVEYSTGQPHREGK
jgi:tetratricopeptide (TPR) repeat protein